MGVVVIGWDQGSQWGSLQSPEDTGRVWRPRRVLPASRGQRPQGGCRARNRPRDAPKQGAPWPTSPHS